MEAVTTGLSQGDFTLLRVLSNGVMTDILTLVGGGGEEVVELGYSREEEAVGSRGVPALWLEQW